MRNICGTARKRHPSRAAAARNCAALRSKYAELWHKKRRNCAELRGTASLSCVAIILAPVAVSCSKHARFEASRGQFADCVVKEYTVQLFNADPTQPLFHFVRSTMRYSLFFTRLRGICKGPAYMTQTWTCL